MHRVHLPAEERRWRSRLAQLVSNHHIIRGSLVVRHRVCGRANCRCAQGEKHASLYLSYYQDGESRQLYIPREKEDEVRRWVEAHQEVRELIDKISDLHWRRLKEG